LHQLNKYINNDKKYSNKMDEYKPKDEESLDKEIKENEILDTEVPEQAETKEKDQKNLENTAEISDTAPDEKTEHKTYENKFEDSDPAEKPASDYVTPQEFYVKNEEDFGKIKESVQEVKSQLSGMSKVDDSEFYEIEPETKRLKLRKKPRDILDRIKEKNILLEFYKIL
jgi:hypothetical protein